jgi:general secretion pathway protein D
LVHQLDAPRERRTWHLSFQNAIDVAEALAASVFHNGSSPLIMASGQGGGGSASSSSAGAAGNASSTDAAGGQATPSPSGSQAHSITIERETLQEGSGSNSLMGSSDNTTGGKSVTYRQRGKITEQISLGANGPILLPDTRSNTLTLMGTAQQIQQAETFISEYDRQRQQVYLELSIIELSDGLTRIITPSIQAQLGKSGINLDFNGSLNNTSSVGYIRPIQNTANFNAVLNFLQQEGKLQVLAKPSVLATHAEEAHISVMDEVIQGFSEVSDQNNNIVARVANITGAGISLNILPHVAANGDVSLRVNPVISFPQANAANNIQLISLREMIAENLILKDGQSFVLGGLKQHLENKTRNSFPGLGNIPVLGNVFNTLDGRHNTSELLIMITPHVLSPRDATPTGRVFSSNATPLPIQHSAPHMGLQAPSANSPFPQMHPLSTASPARKGLLPSSPERRF